MTSESQSPNRFMTRSAEETAQAAKRAFQASQLLSHADRVDALRRIVKALQEHKETILEANLRDIQVCVPTMRAIVSDDSYKIGCRNRSGGWSSQHSTLEAPGPCIRRQMGFHASRRCRRCWTSGSKWQCIVCIPARSRLEAPPDILPDRRSAGYL